MQAASSGSTCGCGGSAAIVAISRRNSATSCPSSGAAWLTTLTATGNCRQWPAYTCTNNQGFSLSLFRQNGLSCAYSGDAWLTTFTATSTFRQLPACT